MSPKSSKVCRCIAVMFLLQLVVPFMVAANDNVKNNCATFTTLLIAEELYTENNGGQDFRLVYCTFLKEARLGCKKAQRLLGDYYFQGKAIEPDYEAAFEWYHKAALQGDAIAQIRLADMYGSGDGVVKDCKQAVDWLFKAAVNGSAEAQFLLGVVYLEGQGVIQDNIVAHMWFCLAADAGYTQAKRIRDFMSLSVLTPSQQQKSTELKENYQRSRFPKAN
jgi:TPR repeat protein